MLPTAEKNAAHLREQQILNHALRGLVEVYENDAAIRVDLPAGFDAELVCRFTFDNMLNALHAGESSCPILFGLLRRTLYIA